MKAGYCGERSPSGLLLFLIYSYIVCNEIWSHLLHWQDRGIILSLLPSSPAVKSHLLGAKDREHSKKENRNVKSKATQLACWLFSQRLDIGGEYITAYFVPVGLTVFWLCHSPLSQYETKAEVLPAPVARVAHSDCRPESIFLSNECEPLEGLASSSLLS